MKKSKFKKIVILILTLALFILIINTTGPNEVYADAIYADGYSIWDIDTDRKATDKDGETDAAWTLCMNSNAYSPGSSTKGTDNYTKIDYADASVYAANSDSAKSGNFQKIKRILYYKLLHPEIYYGVLQNEFYYQDGNTNYDTVYTDAESNAQKALLRQAASDSSLDEEINEKMIVTIYHHNEGTFSRDYQNTITARLVESPPEEPSEVQVNIKALKTLDGNVPGEGNIFNFVLIDASNNEVIQTKQNDAEGNITFEPLTYTSVGTYTYIVKELAEELSGIIYDDEEYNVTVTVTEEDLEDPDNAKFYGVLDGQNYYISTSGDNEEETPLDDEITFENKTEKFGSFTVTKNVTGNMGEKNRTFEIEVGFNVNGCTSGGEYKEIEYVLNGETKKIKLDDFVDGIAKVAIELSDDESVRFENIKSDTLISVSENDYTYIGYDAPIVEYSCQASDDGVMIKTDTESNYEIYGNISATVTNNKDVVIDTGLDDGINEFAYAAVVIVGSLLACLFIRRKSGDN